MSSEGRPCVNTDIDIAWVDGSRIFATEGGGLGIEYRGLCVVKTPAEWHRLSGETGLPLQPTGQRT